MEDDDEFGDLYTDVLHPLKTSFQTQHEEAGGPSAGSKVASSQSRPIDLNINSDDEEILYGAPDLKNSNPSSVLGWNLTTPTQEKTVSEPTGFDLNSDSNLEAACIDGLAGNGDDGLEYEARVLEKGEGVKLPQKASGGSSFMEEDDDINIVVEERENKDDDLVAKDDYFTNKKGNIHDSAVQKENTINFVTDGVVGEMGSVQMIPGLSGRLENHRGSNFENDWESEESEDDLQIVLNDNNHGPMGTERMPGVDDEDGEDGEPLVIVADNGDAGHHHQQQQMMEQEWGNEEVGPGADGEKELGDVSKASGGGGTSAPAAVQPKIAYSNHAYHHPFHSQFKYVRPGAAPMPGAAPGGIPGQVRPAANMGPVPGRGRGDWGPPGMKGAVSMQKGFRPGYSMPIWGVNAGGRGYGSGLDFTLPSHKTIFEVDIDSFEEKPWRLPGIDISNFFNFGLSEDSWKDYCKQLEQLRLETTMQGKIRVYESGRAEQDYDPDLPPELAAAVGIQDIPPQNTNLGKADAGPTDLARASAHGRTPLPIGRPIPVETGSGDRLPSIDTRRLRMHDIDAIIEIVRHSSTHGDDMAEQQDNDPAREDLGGGDEIYDLQKDDAEHVDRFSPAYNDQKREVVPKRSKFKNTVCGDKIVREDPEILVQYHPDREIGLSHEERSTKVRGHVRSPKMTASENKGEKQIMDDQKEESFDSGDGKQSPSLSSSRSIGSDKEQAVAVKDDMNDVSVMDDGSFDVERDEIAVDATTGKTLEDGNLMHSTKKQKLSSRVEQISQENDDGEDSMAARSSENSKAISGSGKDHRRFPDSFEDEVLQVRRPPRAGNIKRPVGDEDNARRKGQYERDETGRQNMAVKGREDSNSSRGGDLNSSLRWHGKTESVERRKESDISEGSWHRRDEDYHGRRIRVEEPRKREHAGEIGSRNRGKVRESERNAKDEHHQSRNQLDNGSWRGANHGLDLGSRQRDRVDNLKSRNEKGEDLHGKRRKEEAYISRGHAEKEDISLNHRESSRQTKRERDDGFDQRKRENQARMKDGDVHYVRQKEEGSFQRERSERQRGHDEWHRLKQEEIFSRRESEEARPVMRSGPATEDKTWINRSRGKDEYKGSVREYHPKDVGRHGDHLKRRDQVENDSVSQHRGHEDVYVRGNQLSNYEKRARYERPGTRDERAANASDTSRMHEHKHKQKESIRKNKESESGAHSSLIPSKRNQEQHGGQISETVNLRGRTEKQSGEIHVNRQSSRKRREEASSDDEQPGSRKGRSKLERWTSHKERDFSITSMSSSSMKIKDLDTKNGPGASLVSRLPDEPSKKIEDKPRPLVDDKDIGAEINNVNPKVVEDKHLDTVEKLKKRSERFKLPLPSEKDAMGIKKMESEPLPSDHTETRSDSEIKSERPARKRRWTGN